MQKDKYILYVAFYQYHQLIFIPRWISKMLLAGSASHSIDIEMKKKIIISLIKYILYAKH